MKKLQQLFDGSRITNLISIGECFEPLFFNEIQHVLDEGSEVLVFSDKPDFYKIFEDCSNFYYFKDYSKTVDENLMNKGRSDEISWVYFDYSSVSEDILSFADRLFALGRVHSIIPSMSISDIALFYKQCDLVHFNRECFMKGSQNIVIGACKYNSYDSLISLVFDYIDSSIRGYDVSKIFSSNNSIDFIRRKKYMKNLELSISYVSYIMTDKPYYIWIDASDVINPSVCLCGKNSRASMGFQPFM